LKHHALAPNSKIQTRNEGFGGENSLDIRIKAADLPGYLSNHTEFLALGYIIYHTIYTPESDQLFPTALSKLDCYMHRRIGLGARG
jgi:hypothetical protein